MINPNICLFVYCKVAEDLRTANYQGFDISLSLRGDRKILPGRRRLWLKYSILNESYYLTDRG